LCLQVLDPDGLPEGLLPLSSDACKERWDQEECQVEQLAVSDVFRVL
jgi:hypothetical protein